MVGLISLLASIVLAVTFVVAGMGKLTDQDGARQGVIQFGVPVALAALTAFVVPITELLLAAGILLPTLRRPAAIGAVLLLTVFTLAIARVLRRGERPDCHCFGQVHAAPVGGRTIVRNAVLISVAIAVAVLGPRPLPHVNVATTALGLGAAVLAVAVVAEAWLLWNLVRRHGQVLLRLEALENALGPNGANVPAAPSPIAESHAHWGGLAVGSDAPDFELAVVGGDHGTLRDFVRVHGPTLLVFSDPGCGPCQALTPELEDWQQEHSQRLTVAVVSAGDADAVAQYATDHHLQHVFIDSNHEVGTRYEYLGTPGAVVVDNTMHIASRLAAGADAIRELLTETLSGRRLIPVHTAPPIPAPAPGPAPGTEAPDFELIDLTETTLRRSDLLGTTTLLLFWNPTCGFCQAMAEDLHDWERNREPTSPELVLVAAGDTHANQAFGFNSPVLLDTDQSVTSAYQIPGTPIGVLVGADGAVLTASLVGADAILHALNPTTGSVPKRILTRHAARSAHT
jgi:peroxiredoxin